MTALGRRNPRLALLPIALLTAVWAVTSVLALILTHRDSGPFYATALLFLVPSFFFLLFIWNEFNRFWSVGLRGADTHVRTGVNYDAALKLVREQLAFLGTGAAKLTNQPAFEKALTKCRPDEPIKFLLMRPDAVNLERAARRAGRDRDDYKKIVLRSLQILTDYRINREMRIEVRFYSGESTFRLMFIDDSLCLASYNVYGEGDGSDFPQLHVMSRSTVTRSFYYAFRRHFDLLWEASEEWDFNSYLGQV